MLTDAMTVSDNYCWQMGLSNTVIRWPSWVVARSLHVNELALSTAM